MSLSEHAASPSAIPKIPASNKQQVEGILASVRSGDSEAVVSALFVVIDTEGGLSALLSALNETDLTATLLTMLQTRAETKKTAAAWIQCAVAQVNLNQPEAALATIELERQTLIEGGLELDALVVRARALSEISQRYLEAMAAWQEVLAFEPVPPQVVPPLAINMAWRGLADALCQGKRYDDALAQLDLGIKSATTAELKLPLQMRRVNAMLESGDFYGGLRAAEELPTSTGNPLLTQLQDFVRIGRLMTRSLDSYRANNLVLANADIDAAILGFIGFGETDLGKMIQDVPQIRTMEGTLWYAKGAILEAENRNEESLSAYTRAEKFETEGAQAALARGHALYKTDAFTEATQAFDIALTRANLSKQRAAAFAGKGRALVRLQQYKEAIANLQSALDARLTEPENDPLIFEQLGIAYSALARNGAANRAFRRAWDLTEKDKRSANLARGVTSSALQLKDPDAALTFLDEEVPAELAKDRTLQFNRALALDATAKRPAAILWLVRARDAGLDRAQAELDRLDKPIGLRRWTNYWFGLQASAGRRAFGTLLVIVAAIGLAAPLFQLWLHQKLDWYLVLLPSAVALLLLALPNMTSISFEGAGVKVTAEPLQATGRESAQVAVPESFSIPPLALAVTEMKLP